MMKRILLIYTLITLAFAGFAEEYQGIAVLPMEKNIYITDEEMDALAGIIEGELLSKVKESDNIGVVSDNDIEYLLKQQQKSFSNFYDEKTAVEVGKLMATRWSLISSLTKLGDTYNFTVSLINVETGKKPFGKIVYDNKIENLRKKIINTIVPEIYKRLSQEYKHTIDIHANALMFTTQPVLVGGGIGYSYSLFKNFSLGLWAAVGYSLEKKRVLPMGGLKLTVGDPRNFAGFITYGSTISAGIYFKNFFLEFQPEMLLGFEGAYGVSAGYSICL
jgi:hypothetical protein